MQTCEPFHPPTLGAPRRALSRVSPTQPSARRNDRFARTSTYRELQMRLFSCAAFSEQARLILAITCAAFREQARLILVPRAKEAA